MLAAAACVSGCGGDGPGGGPSGATRAFALGFTDFPSAATQAAVDDAYRVIREDGDLSVYHMDGGVPWQEVAAGQPYHPALESDLARQSARRPPGHKLYLSVTPIDFHRSGLAPHRGATSNEPLVAPWDTLSFDDPLVIDTFHAYCEQLITRFSPDWFAYAIEANLLHLNRPDRWAAFLTLADTLTARLHRDHPTLPVFATLQLETLYTHLATNGAACQQLMAFCDVLALSTYPYVLSGGSTALPADYWSGVRTLAPDKRLAIGETGWPAEPVTAPYPADIPGSEAAQAEYVRRLLSDLEAQDAAFVNWFFTRDYDAFWASTFSTSPDAAIVRLWKDHGLYDSLGTARPALADWKAWQARRRR